MSYDPVTAVSGFSEFFIQDRIDENDIVRISDLTHDDWQSPQLSPRNGSEMIGLCVAQAGGMLVYDLIEAEPESDRETAAIRSIVPLLGPCLTDGVEVSFDKTSLRALLAHGLYRTLSQIDALKKDQS
ncbi:hypothetical protein [Qipengyuania sp. DGS5-3]|uniref:hypothetical protein n=1 Tax=Qipengyuania sp. DGS5-3 TaxID=3349632 RepID=UPI0036D299F1